MAPKSSKKSKYPSISVPVAKGSIAVGDLVTIANLRITKKGNLKECTKPHHVSTIFIIDKVVT